MDKNYRLAYHKTVQKRLMSAILLPTLIGSLALLVAIPCVFFASMKSSVKKSSGAVAGTLERQISEYENGLEQLSRDAEITGFLDGGGETDAFRALYNFRNGCEYKASFVLHSDATGVTITGPSQSDAVLQNGLLAARMKQKLADSGGMPFFVFDYVTGKNGNGQYIITLSCALRSDNGSDGYVSFIFDQNYFRSVCASGDNLTAIESGYGSVIYKSSEALATLNTRLIIGEEAPLTHIVSMDGGKYILERRAAGKLPLRVVSMIGCDSLSSVMTSNLLIVVVLLGAVTLLINYISSRLAASTMRPLDEVFTALDRFNDGITDYRIAGNHSDDIAPYVEEFNRILDRTDELIHRNTELVNRTREAELKVLQEQLHPHFMFNMLATVSYVVDSNPALAKEMLMALSKMLRYSLERYGGSMVTVEDDFRYLSDYLRLSQIRFGDNFRYEVCVPDNCRYKLIPKLISQPVVENSALHGFSDERPFNIRLSAELDGEILRIIVSDNGAGMTKTQLRTVRKRLNEPPTGGLHIGLTNVQQRIKTQYGEGYGLEIKSRPNEGTTAILTLRALGG